MDALDNMTLRKRRDLLFNRAEVPYAYLTSLMFQYVPPPPFAQAPPVAPPVAQQAPQAPQAPPPQAPPMRDAETQVGGEVLTAQLRDAIMRALNEPRGSTRAPVNPEAASVRTRAQKQKEAAIALEALRAGRPDVEELERTMQRHRQQHSGEMDIIHMDLVHPRPSGDLGRTNERRQTRRRGEN